MAAHVRQIEGERNAFTAPAKHREVREYLQETLGALKPATLRTHTFTWHGVEGQNLVLEVPGRETGQPVLIGAHYDSVPGSPGADDNASGVAATLELARLLVADPPRYPVWLVAFDFEEKGTKGSQALARELKKSGIRPRWMVSLEMVGYRSREPRSQRYPFPFGWFYPDLGDFILMLGNVKAHRLMAQMAGTFREAGCKTERFTVPLRGWAIPPSRFSDHAPFWDTGVPAVLVTDTAWLRNPHYHGPTDRADTLDVSFIAEVVQAMRIMLLDG